MWCPKSSGASQAAKKVRPVVEKMWIDITAELYNIDNASYLKMLNLGFEVFPESSEALVANLRHPSLSQDYYDEDEDDWEEDDDQGWNNPTNNLLHESLVHVMISHRGKGYTL